MIDPNDPGTLDLVAACEEPLSGAERARRHRLKKKQQGVKAISLTQTDRMVLSLGLLAHEDLDHRPADWVTSKKPGFDDLLRKLWPEGDDGRYLAEPQRSTRRPAGFLREQLAEARTENKRLKNALQEIAAELNISAAASGAGVHGLPNGDFSTLEVTDARLVPVWTSLRSDFSRAATALGLLRLRNSQHAELARAVEVLQDRLRAAGMNDRVTSDTKEWYWNESPPADYRATDAPEYMERLGATPTQADELRDAQRYLANARAEIERLQGEQRQTIENNYQLSKRLKAAGLPSDLDKQPGE